MDISWRRAFRAVVPLLFIYASGRAAAQSYPYGHLGIELRRDVDDGAGGWKSDNQRPPSRTPRTAARQRPPASSQPEEIPSYPLAKPVPQSPTGPPVMFNEPHSPAELAEDWPDRATCPAPA